VEISSAARELHGARGIADSPELSADRLRVILDHLARGDYDREDVRDAVVMRIAREFGIER
jgi:hypothetical protein